MNKTQSRVIRAVIVIMIIAIGVIWVFPDRGDGAPSQDTSAKCLLPKAMADEPNICPGYPQYMAKKFRRDKLGNAKGIRVGQKIANKLENKYGRSLNGDDWGWITNPLKSTTCLITNPMSAHRGTCDEGQRSVNKLVKNTSKVILICGGSAIAGAGKNGGSVWGAGWGGGGCLFFTFLDWYYDLIP